MHYAQFYQNKTHIVYINYGCCCSVSAAGSPTFPSPTATTIITSLINSTNNIIVNNNSNSTATATTTATTTTTTTKCKRMPLDA
ncbi:hypothetical protein DPMN_085170 [Dreissena polymorpha]|uniref:Uncharacterized protein n=1 Tax=Dreissena polymorpha TaxID=45954 RepID=A0A9D3YFP2_DREPO|nr:hypothetical protein DPMN_085170 [Dreissena polymorpha]